MDLLSHPSVISGLKKAWHDSNPGPSGGHEEGGFVVAADGKEFMVFRWPRGSGNSIVVPDHPGGRIKEGRIVATFHTHPNTGPDYLQEPSLTDRRAIMDDPELRLPGYFGEFVISAEKVYLIRLSGDVEEVMRTEDLLK